MNINNTLPYDYDAQIRNSFATYPNMHYKQAFVTCATGLPESSGKTCGCKAGMMPVKGGCVAGTAKKPPTATFRNTAPPPPPKPKGPNLLDQAGNYVKEKVGGALGGGSTAAGGGGVLGADPLGLQKMIDNAFGQADKRLDRAEGLLNKGIGESNQWQATVDNIWGQVQGIISRLEGIVSKENLPLVAVAIGGVVIFMAIKK